MGAQRTHRQLRQGSGWGAPAVSPNGRPAGVEGGWDANLLFDSSISEFLKAIPIIRTTHAPSPAPTLGVGRICSFSLCRPKAVGGCTVRADLFSCSLRILGSPMSLIPKSEIRHIPVRARRTRCQLEQCSGSPAPVISPHGGPAGVGDGGMRTPSLDSPISNYLKPGLVIRTAHAPSHAPSLALALMVGHTCIFSS